MTTFTCPLCGTEFNKLGELSAHVKHATDDEHKLLHHVYLLVSHGPKKIQTVMTDYAKAFNCLKATGDLQRAIRLANTCKQKLEEAAAKAAEKEAMKVVCPVCGKPCGTAPKLHIHVKGEQDDVHKLLLRIKDVSGAKQAEIADLHGTFAEAFTVLASDGFDAAVAKAEQIHREVMSGIAAAAANKRRANELTTHAVTTSVRYQRIAREAEEYERLISERELVKREEGRRFAAMPKADRPGALVDYFYSMTGTHPFTVRDVPLVKSLYTKFRLTADQIRGVLKYMHLIGERSLAHVTKLVDEGLEFSEHVVEMSKPGTAASLVKLFYTLRNAKPVAKLFTREERMISTAMRDGMVTYEQAEAIVRKLAAEKGCPLLYFNSRVAAGVPAVKQVNPCVEYTEDHEVAENLRQILAGRLRLPDVAKAVRAKVTAEVDRVYREGSFSRRYDHAEWAFKVGLEMTPERLAIAEHGRRQSWFANALAKCTDAVKLESIKAKRDEYVAWLRAAGVDPTAVGVTV